MNYNMTRWLGLLLLTLISTSFGETPSSQSKKTEQGAPKVSSERVSCVSYCDSVEAQCSSEVRRARSECSKRAATQGRDPFSIHNNDYGYFCGYFGNGNACGTGAYSNACRNRFLRTYEMCVAAIRENVASMRYDCFQTERTAQNYCRDELRDCKASCPKE
jgi:hypothetical protein